MTRIAKFGFACALSLAAVAPLAWRGDSAGIARAAADEPPKVSALANIDDIRAEVDDLTGQFEKDLASEDEFKKKDKLLAQNAYTFAILAHAVNDHDQKAKLPWGANALAVRDAAIAFAKAKDYAAAQAGHQQLKDLLLRGKADGPAKDLKWNQLAPLKEVMLVVNRRNSFGLRRGLRSKQPEASRHATVIALLQRVARDDHHEVKNSADIPTWVKSADTTAEAFAELATMIRERKNDEAGKKFRTNQNLCNDCHKVFRPDVEM